MTKTSFSNSKIEWLGAISIVCLLSWLTLEGSTWPMMVAGALFFGALLWALGYIVVRLLFGPR